MFAQDDLQKAEEVLQASKQLFKAQLKPFFPTMVNVVSLGSETSRAMKEENERRREAALRQRR
jgi:hypothetical protein